MDRPFETEAHDIRAAAVAPILQPGPLFWPLALFLSLVVLAGAVAMFQQLMFGLGVTGLNNEVSWGFYITDMVFFIGLSYGGAVTSAILRLTNAPWRAPMVRLAEATALVTLLIGSLFPIIDLGRPDRMAQPALARPGWLARAVGRRSHEHLHGGHGDLPVSAAHS